MPGGVWAQWRDEISRTTSAAPGHPYPFRLLFSQDFYALSPYAVTNGTWLAYQFHDPVHDLGVVLAYRRTGTSRATYQTQPLGGVTATKTYCFSSWDGKGGAAIDPPRVLGSVLAASGASVVVPAMPGAGVFTYALC